MSKQARWHWGSGASSGMGQVGPRKPAEHGRTSPPTGEIGRCRKRWHRRLQGKETRCSQYPPISQMKGKPRT